MIGKAAYNGAMLRRLRKFLLLLPIPLLFLVLYLAGRSYLPEDTYFRWYRGKLVVLFVSGEYSRWCDRDSERYLSTHDIIGNCRLISPPSRVPSGTWMGFEWVGINFKSRLPGFLMIPYWALAVPLAIASGWSIVTLRRLRQRERPGHCTSCGYDLRATNENCPECGASAPARAPAPATPQAAIE